MTMKTVLFRISTPRGPALVSSSCRREMSAADLEESMQISSSWHRFNAHPLLKSSVSKAPPGAWHDKPFFFYEFGVNQITHHSRVCDRVIEESSQTGFRRP